MSDPRSTYCKKWSTVEGRRRVCTFDKGHEGQCEWDATIAVRARFRDVGPYPDVVQAMKQYATWSVDLPGPNAAIAQAKVQEALMISMVETAAFEREYLTAHGLDPIMATIVAGWIIRAAHPQARLPVEPVQALSVEGDTPD